MMLSERNESIRVKMGGRQRRRSRKRKTREMGSDDDRNELEPTGRCPKVQHTADVTIEKDFRIMRNDKSPAKKQESDLR